MRSILSLFLILFSTISFSQNLNDLDSYTVDEIYKKVDLDYGTLGEDGTTIDFIFVKTDLDTGKYKVDLSDGPNDLYNINGTDLYITLRGYFGYAGYATECILEVDGYYAPIIYKLD